LLIYEFGKGKGEKQVLPLRGRMTSSFWGGSVWVVGEQEWLADL